MRGLMSIAILALLAGCATTPPLTSDAGMCKFKQKPLIVDDPNWPRGTVTLGVPAPVASTDAPELPEPAAGPGPALILSGGSQNGSFGAGFLKRWAELRPGGKLPEFDLVTGISTGAILATWAFIGEPETVAAEYLVPDEKRLLNVYSRPPKSGKIGLGGAITLIRKNSLADLEPLRLRLRQVLDHETLGKVARRAGRFTIAAVEVDTGNAILFDMKEMAARASGFPAASREFEHFRNCYADAVMASSSVPLGAKPVFIDNRMYIDGGARYGVFVDYLSNASLRSEAGPSPSDGVTPAPGDTLPDAPRLYIIVNGTQWVRATCGKVDGTLCRDRLEPDPHWNRKGAHKPWDIAGLAFRSNDILVNQVYRLSAARVQAQYQRKYPDHRFEQHFYFARMHRTDLNNEERFSFEGKSCRQWHEDDKAKLNPFEFYPNYMRCIQAYGANQAEALGWHLPDAKSNFEDYQAL